METLFAPQQRPVVPHAVPFHAHVALLHLFLTRRAEIVISIERLLNCQKKPVEYQQDFPLLSRQFKDCFFAIGDLTQDHTTLRDQLEQAHWASGFKPRANPGNELVDPVEQMLRGFHLWRQTHWPGHKGRVRFAHTLFNLYLLRCLALLCMRLWDDDEDGASARLSEAQAVLDVLWHSSPADQPRLVRDVRWLFPVAMSPTTDSLAGYFAVAQRIAETFADADRLETHKAWVQTGAGHLRAQLRDLAVRRGVSLDDNSLVLITRMSNALDVALLVQGLVTLLEAYERSLHSGDARTRCELAAAICQGISPDPELFVNRLDLLAPYSMIEYLFIETDNDGMASYTETGRRHLALLQQYAALITRLAQPLFEDCLHTKPVDGTWSPYGVLYGFASNLLELMAFKTLQRDADTQFSMEDVFTDGDAARLAWVNGWRNLPHIKPEVVKHFTYPRQFADAIYARVEHALHRRVAADTNAVTGRLFILSDEDLQGDAQLAQIPDLPLRYIVSSDPQLVTASKAEAKDHADLLHCRNEGEFLVSYQTGGGWLAITKDVLTEVLGMGRDAKIAGLPRVAAEVLGLMCPNLPGMQ
jgi:hypothetical protein